jgi:endogenous inhibitor of DNA gyrase (YacG/DUF329 family)
MIGAYGSSLHRPHTEQELMKARQALSLLKAHRARGETAARMLGACIVSNNELKKANSTTYGSTNGNYKRVFGQLQEEKEEKEHSFTPTVGSGRHRLDKVNMKYNIMTIGGEHKPMSNLAILGKNSLGATNDSSNNEFAMKPLIKSSVKKPKIPTQPFSYKPKETPAYNNDEHERPILQGGMDIQAIEEASSIPTAKCPYCERTFNIQSLAKHKNVCQSRPNKKKRKVFDSKRTRVVDEEQEKLEVNIETSESKLPAKKIPKWKLQSSQFRNALKSRKTEDDPMQLPAELDERSLYVQCKTCGRSFNDEVAKRHIPFCANKAKLDAIKNGGKTKPQPTKGQLLGQNKYGKRK